MTKPDPIGDMIAAMQDALLRSRLPPDIVEEVYLHIRLSKMSASELDEHFGKPKMKTHTVKTLIDRTRKYITDAKATGGNSIQFSGLGSIGGWIATVDELRLILDAAEGNAAALRAARIEGLEAAHDLAFRFGTFDGLTIAKQIRALLDAEEKV